MPLQDVIPAPTTPIEAGDPASWNKVEHDLGTILPADYKAFINQYGMGSIGDFLWMLNPFTQNHDFNLMEQLPIQLNILRTLRLEFPEDFPIAIYPEPNGLFPCAISDNGDVLCWETIGSPDNWTMLLFEESGPDYEKYPCSLTQFLQKLIEGQIKSQIASEPPLNRYLPFGLP